MGSQFSIYFTVAYYFGIFISLFSTVVVMYTLLHIHFKDFSTEIRLYSTVIDFTFCILTSFILFISGNIQACIADISFYFSTYAHSIWIFYMSFSMYQIIYMKKSKSQANVKYIFALNLLLSGITSILLFFNVSTINCVIYFDKSFYIFFIISMLLPQVVVFISIIVFYYFIKRALWIEIHKIDDFCNQNRNYFIRLFGYPIIYIILIACTVLSLCGILHSDLIFYLSQIRFILYAYYPLLNSIFYGVTQSSKRLLKAAFYQDSNYNEQEQILHHLRTEEEILPRYYLDLIGESEESIFNS